MPLESSASQNTDGTMNYSITGVKEVGDLQLTAGAFANDYRAKPDVLNPTASQYSVAGGSVGATHNAGVGATLTALNIPNYGNQVAASTTVNLIDTDVHRLDSSISATYTMPKDFTPSYRTFKTGVDYQYKDTFTAGASVQRTPMFQQTDYSVSTGINFNKTPTSSFNVGVGANRTDNQLGRGKWEPRAFLGYRRNF